MRKHLSDMTDKVLISKYINNYNSVSKNNPIRTWTRELNGLFFHRRHMKRCSTLLAWEMQIKTTISPPTCQKVIKKNK